MKILLINPPQTRFPGSEQAVAGPPLGLLYIGAVLEKNGYEVEILDAFIADFPPRPDGDATQYGMPWNLLAQEIGRRRTDVVGITNPFTAQLSNAIRTADIVKQVAPQVPVVVGGPHASVRPIKFLQDVSSLDIAVMGEGEYAMLDIVRHYEGAMSIDEIPGIAYRKGGEVVMNPRRAPIADLDALPLPAYHLVDMEKYLRPKRLRYRMTRYSREIPVITSRGCPFNCVFCSIHLHMGKRWRAHSKDYVVNHLKHLAETYGVRHIHFEDDNLTLNLRRFEDILDALLASNFRITWDTPNGIRADRLNIDIVRKMKRTGCTKAIIGVESGDQWVLDNIVDKGLHLEDVVNAAKLSKEVGIKLEAFYVIGFPGERLENMQRTLEFALRLKRVYGVRMNLLVATPLFGSRLYDICQEKGYLIQEPTDRALSEATQTYGKSLIRTEHFTPEQVNRLASRYLARYQWYLLLDLLREPKRALLKIVHSPGSIIVFLKKWMKLIRGQRER